MAHGPGAIKFGAEAAHFHDEGRFAARQRQASGHIFVASYSSLPDRKATALPIPRYEGGVDTYPQVVTSQTPALQDQRNEIEITRRRLEARILPIKALGAGRTTAQLPKL